MVWSKFITLLILQLSECYFLLFLALEPSSLVCDVGCGNGRYLNSCNPLIYTLGIDRCYRLAKLSKSKGGEVC